MAKKGVKPGTKRGGYSRRSRGELDAAREIRALEAEKLLPSFLEGKRSAFPKDWLSAEMTQKVYLCSFAGLTPSGAARILGVSEKEFLEALKAIPQVQECWDRGQEDIVSLCHVALTHRIRGMKVTEVRRTEKADGGIDTTTITKELPPDIDAVKFFLSNRVVQYQEANPTVAFEGRLDTMLGRLEQMDLFSP